MKRTLLFLLCVLMGTQLFSETLFGYLFPTLAYLERTTCYYTEGDEQYRTINRLSFEDNMFEIDGNDYIEYNDFWLREDKKGRILVYSEPAKKDLVLYDFTLEVGDTLTTLNIDMVPMTEGAPILPGVKSVVVDYPIYINGELSCPIDTLIVTDVSMVMMRDSNEYKKWTFSNGMEYMENIGHLGADFFPIIRNPWEELPACCIEERLVCASIYDRLIYQMDDAEMQRLNAECQCSSWASKWCDTWNVLEFNGMAFEQTAQTWQYKLAYDTIIDGKEYQAVTRHWPADEKKTKEYVAAVRFEENSKAFIYYDNAEYLLYDFNFDLIEGDTLEVFAGINNYEHFNTYKCVIKSVEQTEGGITESTYSMNIIDPLTGKVFPSPMVWKEFVGSYNGILHGDLLVPGNSNYHLLCAYKNSSIIYSTEDEVFTDYGCEYNAVEQNPEDLFPTLWGLERTDVEGTTMGYDDPYHMSFSKYTPTLVDGIWYLFDGRNYFREANNQILWYAPYLNTVDAVLYDWTLQVGDTLPIYSNPFHKDNNRGSLFRVTDVSTITLLDGKEYKKWTFSGGFEVVEGIGAINKGFGHYYCLLHTTHPAVYAGWKPICISKNGQLLYQMDEIKMINNELKCMCELTPSYKDQWCNTWNTIDFDGMRFEETAETWQYKLANDTIINNQKYTIVNRYWTADRNNTKQYVAAVRFTDDRKVYIYYDNAEYLLYDFNVQEGDELEVFAGINNYTSEIKTYKCTVTGVEQYACVGCPAAITLEVHNHPNDFREFYRQTQWIEGVGDINGFLNGINHYVEVDGGYTYCLLCAYHDEEQVYTTDNEKLASYNCEYNAGYEYSSPTLAGLQRTMCREYIGYEGRNETWMTETEKEVLINDKFYRKWDKWLLREENDRIYVYSNKQDILLYDFTLEVGDSLRTLILHPDLGIIDVPIGTIYPIDTLIVTNISTVTLLDGKEYRKWSFNNGEFEYVKGIGCLDGNFLALAKDVVNGDYINSHLVCVSKNGQLLYQMDDAEMERLGAECLCEVEKKWSDTWCNQWNILSHGYQGQQDPLAAAHTSIFWLSNNTVNRDGHEYIPLMCSSSKPDVESTNLIGELRFTEDKQVYFYYDNTEYLLYDFDVQVGDTLDIFGGIELYSYSFVEQKTYPHVITKIDTLDDGRLQITSDAIVIFEDSYGAFEEKMPQTWIEGLGSTNGIVYTSINPGIAGDAAIVMLCAYRDDECVYKTDSNDPYWIDYTQLGCVYNEGDFIEGAFPMLSGLQRTVCNEYCGETEDDNSANNTYKQTFDSIFFENDKPYILCNDYLLREEDNKILIYSQLLNKDLVLYDFTLEVGDSLPALYIYYHPRNAMDWIPYNLDVVDYNKDFEDGTIYPADTFVVTDISNVTLLDGKEYKKWTFDNGMEYVEGIGMYGGRRNGNFFGLIREVVVPCHTGTHLVCVSKNNKLLYQMDPVKMDELGAECLCDYNSGPKRDNAKDGQIGGRPTPTQWNMLEMELRKMENGISILQAETFSYTLEDISQQVNSRTYFQLARQSTKDTATTKSVVGALHFGKEEDNRVYFLRDGVEYVLYDFTAEPGDTIEIFAGINNYPQETTYTHVVIGKDTLENGACRMMLEVVFPEETSTAENVEKVWLAGLGSVDGIVHNAAKRTSDVHAAPARSASSETQTSVMLCAWREDSCLYTTNHPDYDSFGCVYNQDPTSVENPTSPSSYQKLLRDGQLLIIHNDKIYNVMGLDIGKSSVKIVESLTNN